ncbi:MAG TPA: quinoprotein dehydrogenase-associated SoxYZ-like carrier [Burkholderiaceae bacterium]|nr:quinoprotein dehydrogenase-associated SoxYZ-like carrier [Burkholderiaceae bacterium]
MIDRQRRRFAARVALGVAATGAAWSGIARPAAAAEETGGKWEKLRQSLFDGRPIEEDAGRVVALDLPSRAEDAAVVPLSIHVAPPQMPTTYVRKLYVVIDNNPSPMGAVFTLTPDSGRADIETRVRIEDYTNVRAIAETSDGRLYMATHFIKAAGGCSAPAGKDEAQALARLGRMRLRTEGEVRLDEPNLAQLMISHPNRSGLVMDQVTHLYAAPRFVRTLAVTYAGVPILNADLDFTISENPNFRFYFVPHTAGDLKAEIVDSDAAKFQASIGIRPGAVGGS